MTGLSGHHPLFLKAWSPSLWKSFSLFPSMVALSQSVGSGRYPTWGIMQGCPQPFVRAGQDLLSCRPVPSLLWPWQWEGCRHGDETPLPLCNVVLPSAQTHQVSRGCSPVTDTLFRLIEFRSAVVKSACSPVLPVSDSASMQKDGVFTPDSPKSLFVRDILARGREFFSNRVSKARRCFPGDTVCGNSDYVSFRQIVRLLTLADISERNVLVSPRLNYAFAN